jgi:hypothetical protein
MDDHGIPDSVDTALTSLLAQTVRDYLPIHRPKVAIGGTTIGA